MPSGMGFGAAVGLQEVLQRLFLEQQERTRAAEAQRQMDIAMRGQDVSMRGQDIDRDVTTRGQTLTHEIGMGNLGARRDELGQQIREWDEGADLRGANLRFTNAQATDWEGRPQQRLDERSFEAEQNSLDRNLTASEGRANRANAMALTGMRLDGQGGAGPQASPYSLERASRTIQQVDEIMPLVNHKTAGAGAVLGKIPILGGSTDAGALAGKLKTLAASISFNELAQMREASKTGGALGNVSNVELELLSNSLGAIQQDLHPDVLKAELTKIKESLIRWRDAVSTNGGGRAPAAPLGGDPLGILGGQ